MGYLLDDKCVIMRINEEEYGSVIRVCRARSEREANAMLQDIKQRFGLADYQCWVVGFDVFACIEKDKIDDDYFYDMISALRNYGKEKSYSMVSESKLRKIVKRVLKETFDPNDPYNAVELVDDPKVLSGKEWAEKGGNFPVKRNGKIYYVSKSATASLAASCLDKKHGVWCVLANQRGPGADTGQGLWNLPCGYVERNESAEDGARRETFEETGVEIPETVQLRNLGARSSRSEKISYAFTCVLPGSIENYPVSDENSEPGEVADIRWIPIMTVGGTPLYDVMKKYHWNKNPWDIIKRAQTALMPYIKTNDNYDMLVNKLKDEIKSNPTAMFLLNKLISMNK